METDREQICGHRWGRRGGMNWESSTETYISCCCSVTKSCLTLCNSTDCRLPCPSPTPGACSNSCPSSQWCHPTHLILCHPLASCHISSSCLQSFPASVSFLRSLFFTSGGQNIGAAVLESVLPMNIQVDFLQDWLGWSPCSLGDTQEFSQAPQFESISSLVLSLFYGPTLISVHDYWKNHSFDQTDLCQQYVSCLHGPEPCHGEGTWVTQ